METLNFIIYENICYIEDQIKKGNYLPAKNIEYLDVYLADDFRTNNDIVMPRFTMFKTTNKAEDKSFILNLSDNIYDYYYYDHINEFYIRDAISKYVMAEIKRSVYYVVYINDVSIDNILFDGKVDLLAI